MKKTLQLAEGVLPKRSPNASRVQVELMRARLDDKKITLAIQEQELREAEKAVKQKEKDKEKRKKKAERERMLMNAGKMMEMAGLLRYHPTSDNITAEPHDELRVNMLVGGLLKMAYDIAGSSTEELEELIRRGKNYREKKKSERLEPPTNARVMF